MPNIGLVIEMANKYETTVNLGCLDSSGHYDTISKSSNKRILTLRPENLV